MQRLPILAAALSGAGFLQAQRDAGPLLAAQITGTVRPGTMSAAGPRSPREMLARKAGFAPLVRRPSGLPAIPDFSFAALFPDFSHPSGVAQIVVDAFSVGNDFINADSSGQINLGAGQWAALLFSVEQGTSGGTSTGVVAAEEGRADGAGADVFAFAYGSLPVDLQRITQRVADSPDLDLFGAGVQGELLSLDVNVPSYDLDTEIVPHLDGQPTVFFSVTTATRGNVPAAWWGAAPGNLPSGATILYTKWMAGAWSPPQPAFRFGQLGLDRDDDVDAVAVQCLGSQQDVVFSTRALGPVATSQLMFISFSGALCGPTATELKDADGMPIAGKTGSGDGNIDAVCLWDPSFLQGGAGGNIEAFIAGTPYQVTVGGFARTLDAAAWRTCALGVPTLSSYMTGEVPGSTTPETVLYALAIGPYSTLTPTTLVYFQITSRAPGRRQSVHLPELIPVEYQDLFFAEHYWAVYADTGAAFAYPVRIRM